METVSKKEKVKLGSGLININPPPSDRRCDCCGKHIDELKPYGKAGDPLGGDFNGALLVKEWRAVGTYVEEAEKAKSDAYRFYANEGYNSPEEMLIQKYGKEKAEEFALTSQAYHDSYSSWECRDCILLNEDEHIKVYNRTWNSQEV